MIPIKKETYLFALKYPLPRIVSAGVYSVSLKVNRTTVEELRRDLYFEIQLNPTLNHENIDNSMNSREASDMRWLGSLSNNTKLSTMCLSQYSVGLTMLELCWLDCWSAYNSNQLSWQGTDMQSEPYYATDNIIISCSFRSVPSQRIWLLPQMLISESFCDGMAGSDGAYFVSWRQLEFDFPI